MFEYSAWQFGHTTQSSSKNSTGVPQKSHGSPSSAMSKVIFRLLRLGVAEILSLGVFGCTRGDRRGKAAAKYLQNFGHLICARAPPRLPIAFSMAVCVGANFSVEDQSHFGWTRIKPRCIDFVFRGRERGQCLRCCESISTSQVPQESFA